MPPASHILTYAQTLGPGGVERAQLRLARDWLTAGRRVTLVVGEATGPLAPELPPGLNVIALGSPRQRALLGLPAVIRRERPDVIFCPGNHYTGIAAWTRARLGSGCPPIVVKMSSAPARRDHGRLTDAAHRAWLRLHPRFVDQLVAMTPATAAAAAVSLGLSMARVSVIANPPARPLPGATTPPLPDGRYLLGVGRLVPQKRWDRLIAALPRLADRDVSLVLLGDGVERERLVAEARSLGVASRVHLPGHAADPLPAMAGAVALVLPSEFEGVPGVLREALSVGTPVIATDSSVSVAEIVADPSLGTIVPRDDPAALVAALDDWLRPGRSRPTPVPQPGSDSADRYLALFDRIVRPADRQAGLT